MTNSFVRIPKFTFIEVVDENGVIKRRFCTQKSVIIETGDIMPVLSSEKPTEDATMAAQGKKYGSG